MAIGCTSVIYTRNLLHQIMNELGFTDLMICIPSTPDTIFIVKRSVELD